MAVPQPGESEISRASLVSNGSIHVGPDVGAEEVSPALAAAYRHYWTTPEETEPLETFMAIHAEIGILEAQLDPAAVISILEQSAQSFHRETGICPFCGKAGELHHGTEGHEG
jgi:hypothetical protein